MIMMCRDLSPVSGRLFLYELDLVAVRVFNKCNHGGAMLHGPCFSSNLAPTPFHLLASLISIVYFNCDMPIGRSQIIPICIPVMRQLQYRAVGFILVTHKCQCKPAFRVVLTP